MSFPRGSCHCLARLCGLSDFRYSFCPQCPALSEQMVRFFVNKNRIYLKKIEKREKSIIIYCHINDSDLLFVTLHRFFGKKIL